MVCFSGHTLGAGTEQGCKNSGQGHLSFGVLIQELTQQGFQA